MKNLLKFAFVVWVIMPVLVSLLTLIVIVLTITNLF